MSEISERGLLAVVVVVSTLLVWLMAGMKNVVQNYDGPYYAVVARCFYDKTCIGQNFSFPVALEYYPAHFPLFPVLILIGGWVVENLLLSGVLVNLLATTGGVWVIYFVWRRMKWESPFWAAFGWLFAWPRIWAVRSVSSPETLFVALIVSSLYAFSKQKFWLSGLMGALATLTKSPGILLFVAYCLWWIVEYMKTKRFEWRVWPVLVIPLALAGLFGFYQIRTGDFWAYFHSGDNIHLQLLPFKVFSSNQPWVGDFWLEDVLWVYLIGGGGVFLALRKNQVWGWFGIIYFLSILFVSHRDIARYSLPLVPVVLLGISPLLKERWFRWAIVLWTVPMLFYTVNFVLHNTAAISDFGPFLLTSSR